MNFYEIGYWSMEEVPRIIFTNEKNYTQDQFDDLIIDLVKELKPKLLKDYKKIEDVNFENCLYDIVRLLKNNFGFEPIKPSVIFRPFGWASIKNKNDWIDETKHDRVLNKLRDALNEA